MPTIDEGRIRLDSVDFDRWGGEVPFEDSQVLDEDRFSTLRRPGARRPGRCRRRPVARRLLAAVLRRRAEADTLGLRFSLARRELEASWGVANLEVPLSAVCQTDGFLLVRLAPSGPAAPVPAGP